MSVRNIVKRHVVETTSTVHEKVRELVQDHFNDGEHAGFTTDMWTDGVKKKLFMSVTMHYIDRNFKLHVRNLHVKVFQEESHIGSVVLKAFEDALHEFGCKESDRCVVCTDSRSNMAATEGIRKIYKWIVGADHKIATVLTTVFNKTSTTTDGVRSSPFYRYHEFAPHLFEMIDNSKELIRYFKQANLQNSLSKTLKQENVTRWNSLLISLNSILDSYDEVTTVLSRFANINRQANKQFLVIRIDKTSLADLVRFLRRFQTVTLKLEQYLEPTIHLVSFEQSALSEYCKPRNEPYNDEDAEGNKFTIPSDNDDIAAIKMLIKDVLREK
ncbi:hypothetical protein CBR_g18578 [Chara braunii]|uniref:DUF4371 domain-containing protein n=1 Tax=Chara braunii TaxID=69332 RepID=A0A388JTF3_CHABU|nr:hypothetical protein CBR_g18578 [Chara braunii]|eukprot:GBG60982.1 hypothetical protein CBR_g18578 [Chara braunii]